MSFTDHKITQFQHKIADLADQPTLPPDELKARFDACPEELRQSLNAVCDDAARLEARVEGIVVDTFGDTIDKEMLSDELAAELDGKATQTALSAEAAARESADDALQTAVAQKCEVLCGTYTATHQPSQDIVLGFQPRAVWLVDLHQQSYYQDGGWYCCCGGMLTPDMPLKAYNGDGVSKLAAEMTDNGFRVYYNEANDYSSIKVLLNYGSDTHFYMAFR